MNRREWIRLTSAVGAGMILSPRGIYAAMQDPGFTRSDFGEKFRWGVATAAYQIEGAGNVDGKGPSVWDTFVRSKGKIKDGTTGDIACDFYNRFAADLDLLKSLGIPDFRFSLSWTRLLPGGTGTVNEKGVDFYNRVIDACLERGITPWVTLFHWDTPQALEDKGGWTNRDMVNWFREYAELCVKRFGDRVQHWMVLNEPMAFIGVGYMLGIHAPGRKGIGNFLPAAHHAALCQAEGGRVIRSLLPHAHVGTTFSAAWMEPWEGLDKHRKAAARADALFNRFFLEPALGLGYPLDTLPLLKRIHKYFHPGDEEKLAFDFDFIGLQNYTRELIRKSLWPPVVWAKIVPPEKRPLPLTDMQWEVYPQGIYHLLKKFSAYKGIRSVIVTENGAAFPDVLENGAVHDKDRTQFLQNYLAQVLRAKNEGVPVDGYFVWTFLDNFEWAEGFRPRFGLVHVDFETQKRTVKDSGLWYSEFLKG